MGDYPLWRYYPPRTQPPEWVNNLVGVFETARARIDSAEIQGRQSDGVLLELRSGLEGLGYEVESSKVRADRIERPVLFGDQGKWLVKYEVDAVHDELGVLLEVEAGRGMMGNAFYRDVIRSALVVGARFLAVAVMAEYRYKAGTRTATSHDFLAAHSQLDAIYASGRLELPFEGILLVGY